MTDAPIVKQPHYVWRHYLEAWERNGKLSAYRNGGLFDSAARNVAKEGGFHRLRELSARDIELIKLLCVRPGSVGEEANLSLINNLVKIHDGSRIIIDNPTKFPPEVLQGAKKMIHDTEEILQSGIENRGYPWLAALRAGDKSFRNKPESMLFPQFLAMQLFRTKAIMDKMVAYFSNSSNEINGPFIDRTWPLMRHLFATNVGGSLHLDRHSYEIVFIRRGNSLPFITSAQPIWNTHVTGEDGVPPIEFELYYPLSPSLAMLYTNDTETKTVGDIVADDGVVDFYNQKMVAASPNYLFADSRETLCRYVPR